MQKLKIVIVGPSQTGKTLIANTLSEANESLEVRPTQGCRIVEFELNDIVLNNKVTKVLIELWDCSGQHKFNNCWPIIRDRANGVILVHSDFNLETQQELDMFYKFFVTNNGLNAKHCVVFNHTGDNTGKLGSNFLRISQIKVDLSEIEVLKKDFSEYITSLLMLRAEANESRGSVSSRPGGHSITGM
uniref:Putative ras of complex n=1 Tax=Xenopsylla cheopis TaxID=163159 RepID=A0A6M2DNY3_XENCH